MFKVSILQGAMGLVRAALAALLFAWVPLADAATCSVDNLGASAMTAASLDVAVEACHVSDIPTDIPTDITSDDTSGGKPAPLDAQHCVHGHCHHPFSPQAAVDTPDLVVMAQTLMSPPPTALLARTATGPERPPKA